jgi:hypothetical protein
MLYPQTKRLSQVALLAILSLLAACGDNSEQEEACDQADAGNFVILNGLACIFGSTDGGTTITTGATTTSAPQGGVDVGFLFDEYEPNSSLQNSNPITLGDAGVKISGAMNFESDMADSFLFTPSQSGAYDLYLCGNSCSEILVSDALSLMVLDQSQTTIDGTALGSSTEQVMTLDLHAGLPYYVEVSTLAGIGDYELVLLKSVN